MKTKIHKGLSWLISLCMVAMLFPMTALAIEPLNVTVDKLSTVNDSDGNTAVSQANQDAVTVARNGNAVTVSGNLSNLNSFASTNEAQGNHKWVGLVVDTGVSDITTVTCNGTALTQADVDEAASVGVPAGRFVLWIKAEEAANTPKTITLGTEGKSDTTITISFADTTPAPLTVTVSKLTTVNQDDANTAVSQANQDAVTVARNDNAVTVSGNLSNLNSFASTNEAQGNHKWVGLVVDTGVSDITTVTCNGTALTQADVDEAASVGVPAGRFVLWIKAEEAANTPKTITLGTEGKSDTTITISFADTTPAPDIYDGGGSAPAGDTAATTVSGTTDASGKTTAAVTEGAVSSMVDAAKKAEAGGKEAVVEIKINAASSTTSVALTIPAAALSNLAANTDAAVMIDAGIASVTFDPHAVDAISSAAGANDVSVAISSVNSASLPAEAQKLVGSRPVYDFTITAGSTTVSSFGGGSAEVSVPYALQPGEDVNAIVVYYIDAAGVPQSVRGAYNSAEKSVDFVVSHFSKYAVGYNKVSFTDVKTDDWYCDSVAFCAARGITTGATATTFSPAAAVTRGQFVVMLMRAYGIEPDVNPASNFADAGKTYYTNYLAKARELGITAGIGKNLFAPNKQITRQEMFTLLYSALVKLGELPAETSGKDLSSFSDASSVADYAKAAMTALVKGGVITGSDGKLSPQGPSTRAQMVQVLYALLSK